MDVSPFSLLATAGLEAVKASKPSASRTLHTWRTPHGFKPAKLKSLLNLLQYILGSVSQDSGVGCKNPRSRKQAKDFIITNPPGVIRTGQRMATVASTSGMAWSGPSPRCTTQVKLQLKICKEILR